MCSEHFQGKVSENFNHYSREDCKIEFTSTRNLQNNVVRLGVVFTCLCFHKTRVATMMMMMMIMMMMMMTCSQNDQRDAGIILSHVCWGRTPPPPARQVG